MKRYFKRLNIKELIILFLIFLLIINVWYILNHVIKIKSRISPINVNFNIFMIETNDKSESMTFKQMCSIESAAKHNPQATVHVNSVKARITIPELLESYENIKLTLINLDDVFEGTSLKQWWLDDKLAKHDTYYRYSHLSDAIRITLIYKNGGFYSDLDHITIKSYLPLIQHSALVNNNMETIFPESSFFYIKKNHGFLKLAIEDFALNYNGTDWGANGPRLLQRNMKRYCNTEDLNDLLIIPGCCKDCNSNTKKCDIGVLPPYVAYPYAWNEAYKMFETNGTIDVARFLNTYTIHFNSKVTSNYDLSRNDNSIMDFFMVHNCPIVYKHVRCNQQTKYED